jgi:hypothetical protein
MTLEIQVLVLNRHENVAGLNRVMESQTSPQNLQRQYIQKQMIKTPTQIHVNPKRPHTITTNERKRKHEQYNSRVNKEVVGSSLVGCLKL